GGSSRGHTRAHVRRLVSKYSRRPSQHTPSKSSARMSGMVMPGHHADAIRAEERAPPPHKGSTFQPSTSGLPLAASWRIMVSPERNISAGSPAGVRPPSVLDERLASL